jgi:rhamnogalacturonyl hydrolase YesR
MSAPRAWPGSTNDKDTLLFLSEAAEHYNYGLRGSRSPKLMLNADEWAIGDLYEELYARRQQPGVIMPLRQRLDWSLPHLTRTPIPQHLVWWWSDALFMAPPVLARMSVLTGDRAYLDAMDKQWWRTFARLYDPDESLYFRDERFIERRTANGKKVFWSRGDGWVMAGTARVLESMPADYLSRPRYIAVFQAMAKRVAGLQQANGLWTASLLDTEAFPEAETSGSAFFVYALAWGINHGLLDRATYLPVVVKGWKALEGQGPAQRHDRRGAEDRRPAGHHQGRRHRPLRHWRLPAGGAGGDGSWPADPRPALGRTGRRRAGLRGRHHPDPGRAAHRAGPEETARRAAEMKAVAALAYDPEIEGPGLAAATFRPPPRASRPRRRCSTAWPRRRPGRTSRAPPCATPRTAGRHPVGERPHRPPHLWPGPGTGRAALDLGDRRLGQERPLSVHDPQLRTGDQHAYHGEGVDYYNVKTYRGAGGLGVWDGGKLWVSRNWKSYKILKDGPDVAAFKVDYAPWAVGAGRKVWESRTFTLPMGTNFTRMVSTIGSDSKAPLTVAIGITKKPTADKAGELTVDRAKGVLSFWDVTDPDKGTMGVALLVDPRQIVGVTETDSDYLVLLKVTPGKPFVYYMGAAWDKGLDFHSRADWEAYVRAQEPRFDPTK